ncbi:hypothetical protein I312_103042 [Cryptococcus bacillisporus CA1280]|uniref:uncharacterized protein n=1 Tax=Cryptococcus bacillisporus CA1280 TaxID=1296109 RepID=UPI003365F4D0
MVKKRTIQRRVTKKLPNNIKGRTRTFQTWVNQYFGKALLSQCKERLLLKWASSVKGILRSLDSQLPVTLQIDPSPSTTW